MAGGLPQSCQLLSWLSIVIIIRKVYRSYKPFIPDFQNSRKLKTHHNISTIIKIQLFNIGLPLSWFLWLAFQKVDHVKQKCVSDCYGSIVLIQTWFIITIPGVTAYYRTLRDDSPCSLTSSSQPQHTFTFVFLRRGIESVQLWSEQKLPRSKHCINENWAFYLTEF